MNRITKITLLVLLCILLNGEKIYCQTDEYTVKAVFLERFTRFVEWPEATELSDSTSPFILGIYGTNPFGDTIYDIYADQKIKNKRVQINKIATLKQAENCHMLFISQSKRWLIGRITEYLRDKPVLTIGDTPGYANQGVHINFYIEKDEIRFEINKKAVDKAGLHMSFLLLELGKIIEK